MRYSAIFTLTILLLIPAEGVLSQAAAKQKMNALSVIFPYKLEGVWVFDDATIGVVREPFISGADKILDVLAEHIPNAADGFKIVFSARPFPGYTAPIRLDSSRIRRQLVSVARAANGRMVVSRPP